MADAPGKRKRTFRKFSYRGVDLDQLLELSTDSVSYPPPYHRQRLRVGKRRDCVPPHFRVASATTPAQRDRVNRIDRGRWGRCMRRVGPHNARE